MAQSDRPELGAYLREQIGVRHVYFNPTSSTHLEYPCIIYFRDDITATHADNIKYRLNYRYSLTLIDRDPDSKYVEKLALLPHCNYSRHYFADNLSHDVFTIYFK